MCRQINADAHFANFWTYSNPKALSHSHSDKGPVDPERGIHETSVSELEELARDFGALIAKKEEREDAMGCGDIRWIQLAIRFPDDGTGSLPLIRHIILNQSKSGTHKLALLRTLCRIADGAAGMAYYNLDNTVSVPMGLVALTWVRLYKPLLDNKLPQLPTGKPPSFVKKTDLSSLSSLDLRVGMPFSGAHAETVHCAIKNASENIRKMPIRHMAYPSGQQILHYFPPAHRCPNPGQTIQIDKAYLFSFGEMRIPEHLWQALRAHALWIEPVIVAEWSKMISGYAQTDDLDAQIKQAMQWADPERDVQQTRKQARKLLEQSSLHCVWSGKRLRENSLDIDHCLPWSVWSCGDLWNLMPADRNINQNKKRDLLPSDTAMEEAQDRILDWWDRAYWSTPSLRDVFLSEATSSLPGMRSGKQELEEIFESVCQQRQKLKRDQQAPEWPGYNA